MFIIDIEIKVKEENKMDENMNNNMNYNGMNANLYNNQNTVPEKRKKNIWIILITIVVAVATVFGKINTFGWITILGIWSMIMPLHSILFVVVGIIFSGKKEKKMSDYIIYFTICITNLLYAFLFVDVGDNETSTLFNNVSNDVLNIFTNVSLSCFLISYVLIIFLLCKCNSKKKIKTNQNVYVQQNMYKQPNGQQNYYQQPTQTNNLYQQPNDKQPRS